ncbi:hypothetical protein GCM10020295_35390 [Streptomyces cinereospinus]
MSTTGAGTGAADTAGRVLAALANATRREVPRLLRDGGPQPVQAPAGHFAMRRPSLFEHLRVLRDAGAGLRAACRSAAHPPSAGGSARRRTGAAPFVRALPARTADGPR